MRTSQKPLKSDMKNYFSCVLTLATVSETSTILCEVGLKQQNVTALVVPPSRVNNSCPDVESHT